MIDNTVDLATSVRGDVKASLVSGDAVIAFSDRHNSICNGMADAMASSICGRRDYTPDCIGFIYGDDDDPNIPTPFEKAITWANLKAELAEYVGNVQVVDFASQPTTSSSDSGYNANKATFSGVTQSGEPGVLDGQSYAGNIDAGSYVYGALLMHRTGNESNPYIILARVSLKEDNAYKAIPESFEVMVNWSITVK